MLTFTQTRHNFLMLITLLQDIKTIFPNKYFPQVIVENQQTCGKDASFSIDNVNSSGKTSIYFFNSSSIPSIITTCSISTNRKFRLKTLVFYSPFVQSPDIGKRLESLILL